MKKRSLVTMWLFGLITLGIYSFFATLSILKGFYKLNGTEEAFRKRMNLWGLMYFSFIAAFIATIAFGINGYGFLGFAAGVVVFMILMTMITMFVQEFAVVAKVSNDFGIKTGIGYMYIVPCLAYNNFIVISLVLQNKLSKVLDEKTDTEYAEKLAQ